MAVQRPTKVGIAFVDPSEIVEPEAIQTQLALRGRIVAQAALLVGVVLAVYAIALRGSFIYFDDKVITTNGLLRTFRGLWPIWIHPTILPHYQPLAYCALLIEFKLFGTRLPGGYLAVNLLLHATNVVLLWTLLCKLEIRGALAAAALFAAHPINVEAVAWISQQPLLLSGAFGLSAVLVYLRYAGVNPPPQVEGARLALPRSKRALYGLACALFLAAIACHAAAAILPVVLLAVIWWERGRIGKRDLMPLIPLAVASLVWAGLTLYTQDRASHAVGPVAQLLTAGPIVCIFFWHLIWPVKLAFAYPKWASATAAVIMAVPAAVAAALMGAWMLRGRAGRGPIAGVALPFVLLLPALMIQSDVESSSHVADHLGYFAAMAMIVGIVSIVPRTAPRWGVWPGRIVAGAICALLGAASIGHVSDYQTSQNLWNAALRADPGSATAHNYLGLMELEDNNDPIAAMEHFEAASQRDPENAQVQINMGRVYELGNDTEKAVMRYQQAVRLAPYDPDAHFALAGALERRGESAAAIAEYLKVLELRPGDLKAMHNMAYVHLARGETAEAIQLYQRVIKLNPTFVLPYLHLAEIEFNLGEDRKDLALVNEAALTLETALKIDPTFEFNVRLYSGVMTRRLSRWENASESERTAQIAQSVTFLRRAVMLQPMSAEAQCELGKTLLLAGMTEEGMSRLKKAVELDPREPGFVRVLRAAEAGRTWELVK